MSYRVITRTLFAALALTSMALTQAIQAKGAELRFDSTIQMISQTSSTEGTVTIVTNGFEVPVLVNGDTEIHLAGSEALLDELNVGDAIRVNAFFSAEGITAEEIAVLQKRDAHFRLHGDIAEIEQDAVSTDSGLLTRVRLLGVDVYVRDDTRITQRGVGFGNQVPVESLAVGSRVDVHGNFDEMLLAERIHVGSRQLGNIELEGQVASLAATQLTLILDDGGEVSVIIDSETEVSGTLEDGAFVEVEGALNADLAVVATEIVVDTDGDGDADDNNSRRPTIDLPDVVTSRFSAELVAVDEGSSLSGSVRLAFPPVEKTIELKVSGAEAGSEMSVHVLAAGSVVELGMVVVDADGEVDAELDYSQDAIDMLPVAIGPGDIEEIEVSIDGTVVLRGSF